MVEPVTRYGSTPLSAPSSTRSPHVSGRQGPVGHRGERARVRRRARRPPRGSGASARSPSTCVFGGQFFVQARVADLGLTLDPDRGRELARAGALIKLAAPGADRASRHPRQPGRSTRSTWSCCTPATGCPASQDRNTVVLSNGRCAPTTHRPGPARWTAHPAAPAPAPGWPRCTPAASWRSDEKFVHRSIIGTEFVGELTGTTTVGPYPAVLPTITGRGWVTGTSRWVLDDTDPFPTGYTVGDIWAPPAHRPRPD